MQIEGMWKVVVGNVSRHANDHYLQDFFSPIGVLHGSSLHYPARNVSATGFAELLFLRQDEALAAGKMTGWSICNETIVVSPPEFCPASQLRPAPLSPPAYGPTSAFGAAQADGRRAGGGVGEGQSGAGHEWVDETVERKNLYVLNLPIDMTNEEMLKLFQPFGTVVHSCILAILDSSARRRGFILMGSGVEATAAMRGLHGQVYRDYVLDVSYSVVQKTTPQKTLVDSAGNAGNANANTLGSAGGQLRHSRSLPRAQPFDALRFGGGSAAPGAGAGGRDEEERDVWSAGGVGRAPGAMSGRPTLGQPQQQQQQQQQAMGAGGAWDARRPMRIVTANGGGLDTLSEEEVGVLVDNMSPVVFHTADDVDALFSAFGRVVAVELVPSLLEDRPNAAVVRFERRADAERARRSLEGKTFGGREIRLGLLDSPAAQGPRQARSATTSSADWVGHHGIGASVGAAGQRLQAATLESMTPTRLQFASPPAQGAMPRPVGGGGPTNGGGGGVDSTSNGGAHDLGPASVAARSTVFDPFRSSPFELPPSAPATSGSAALETPPSLRLRQLSKDTVELCHPLPTNLARLQTAFPPPPHSFADTLTPRPHYSSPPPALPRHEGGMGHLRTRNLSVADEHQANAVAAADADDLAFSDASSSCASTADGSFASPNSSLGRAWWRRNSAVVASHEKTLSADSAAGGGSVGAGADGAFTYFGSSTSSSPGGGLTALGAGGFSALGAKESAALTEVVLGSSLSSVL